MMNYSDVEAKVREATNDDAWGPHGTLMTEIAKYTFTYEHYPEAMSMLWKRMFESKKAWRRTYKVCYVCVVLLDGGDGGCNGSHLLDLFSCRVIVTAFAALPSS